MGRATGHVWIGLDIGSVSVKGSILDSDLNIINHIYKRSHGQPVQTTFSVLSELTNGLPSESIKNVGVTGSAGELIASLVDGIFINEIVALSKVVVSKYPHIKTLVEMGGEDSKLLQFKRDDEGAELEDFSMNNLCAAGTGSFLDQQANRIDVSIEDEFGKLALKSKNPPRVAGRCSVFAKSDMIHLQQVGTPVYDIVAGLCYAVARTFIGNVGRGKEFTTPIAFFGGVAANAGVVKALADELEIEPDDLFIPIEHAVMGSVGACLASMDNYNGYKFNGLDKLENYKSIKQTAKTPLAPLTGEKNDGLYSTHTKTIDDSAKTGCYIGVDIGSLSTNVVAIDENLNVIARRYIRTQSRPISAVTRGLLEIGEEIGDKVKVKGVGTTGSGRYMISDYIGADVVRNEITAQATAAIHFIPNVDTIFEIGGQDSKYVSVESGAVVDFAMNKVCAAGTGSFIEEQAEKIDLDIEKEFASTAFQSQAPGKFGDRCTVFIESDLVSNQQKGMAKEDLAAGLAYSIVSNYINRVVGDRKIGKRILFQGGVAWNRSIVAAFESVTGKKITVPPHHDVTGAVGAAIIARKHHERQGLDTPSNFLRFDLRDRNYKVTTFECKACDNVCGVSRVKFEGKTAHYYGARCELFEGDKKKKNERKTLLDLFAEREELLFGEYADKGDVKRDSEKPLIGIPRALTTYELFPFWRAFFETLELPIVLSGRTNHEIIHESVEQVKAETCFPIKVMHGHVSQLIDEGVDYIFMPSIITMNNKGTNFVQSHTCPLVQSIPYIVRSALDLHSSNIESLEPAIYFQFGDESVAKELSKLFGKKIGIEASKVKQAVKRAREEQSRFYSAIKQRGREAIEQLNNDGEKPVAIISRPYNGCDPGINLDLPRKLRDMGKVAMPIDFLDFAEEEISKSFPDMYWRSGQRILAAAQVIRQSPNIDAIFISNFKCGPDSFIEHCLESVLAGKPVLGLEIDEHSADAGAVTRLEAFFDSLENVDTVRFVQKDRLSSPVNGNGSGNGKGTGAGSHSSPKEKYSRKIYLPYMCDHGHTMAAALRYVGYDAELLPMSDQNSQEFGLKNSSGKECIPFALTTGDIIKKIKEPGFDPNKSAFLMPTANGPCRFGQYQRVQRLLLDKMGLKDLPLLSPDSDDGYSNSEADEFSVGVKFRRTAWRGVVVVDILLKLLHETRPYELNHGETEQVYKDLLEVASKHVEQDSSELFRYVYEIRDRFKEIAVNQDSRPVIGVVGEIYMRSHNYGNRDLIKRLESLGGEVWLAPLGEWVLYCTNRWMANSWSNKKYLDLVKGYMQDIVQKSDEHRLYKPFAKTLARGLDASTSEILKNAGPYMDKTFEGEAILSIGKSVEFARKGLSGVVNIMPFSCMPGTIVSAISGSVREDNNNIPWLNLDYDGVEETNSQTRLEAFMYQAEQYREKQISS